MRVPQWVGENMEAVKLLVRAATVHAKSPCHTFSLAGAQLFCCGILLAGSTLLSGCVSARTSVTPVPVQPQVLESALRFRKEYILAAGDQIEVAVRRVPEVSRNVTIRPDGFISLPMLQDVLAAGSTPRELAEKLTQLFSARLLKPEVNVLPLQVRQPAIYVVGDVNAPGTVPFRDAPTAMQALAFAGGMRRSAAARDVAIIRITEDGFLRVIRVTADAKGQPGPYAALRSTSLLADDVIFVPESSRSQISRFFDEVLTRPIVTINSILGTYLNFRLVQEVSQ